MAVETLIPLIETYFEQRQRCFNSCWSTKLQLRQLDQQAASWFYLLNQHRKQIEQDLSNSPCWLNLVLAREVSEIMPILRDKVELTSEEAVCLQWWSQRHNSAVLLDAVVHELGESAITSQLLCAVASASIDIEDQFNFGKITDICPYIHFINQHLGKASLAWFTHFKNSDELNCKSRKIIEFILYRGVGNATLPVLSSPLLADQQLIKQYITQANARQAGILINELSTHNENAKFVLSLMAFSGYKQFVPWLIQMLTAGFLSHAAFSALHTLLGEDFESHLPAELQCDYEPESQAKVLVVLKQALADWWQQVGVDYPERLLAGKAITAENIRSVWQQGNIQQCEVAAYHHWCSDVKHRLSDATAFNVGVMI